MLLGCIADDFTGASDLANTLAKEGMSTVLLSGVPDAQLEPDCDAAVVALKTRSGPAADAVAHSLDALRWLRARGCRQFFFKYCSTFDSTPAGNIGPVADALLDALDGRAAIVCPAFPATGRSLFMGHLFVNGRLLSESGMERHPLNPMTDPDIRRWLARQTKSGVGLVPHATVQQGSAAISAALEAAAHAGDRFIVVDAVTDDDLLAIGAAIADNRLVTGGSGVALGLPANFRRAGLLQDRGGVFEPLPGPGVVLSGSCSSASNAQVQDYLSHHPGFAVRAGDVMADVKAVVDEALAFVENHIGQCPIVYSTAQACAVEADQDRYGREALARRIELFFAALSAELVDRGVSRLVVGGGETSGAVVTGLGIGSMKVGPEIDPGVPALAADTPRRLRLALKSGNFGTVDFFDKALAVLGETSS